MKKKILTILTLMIITAIPAFTHPHIVTLIYPHVYFDNNGMNGFYLQWIYDPMYSSQIIYDIDTDMDMELDEDEQSEAKKDFFSVLKKDSWFMTISVNGEDTEVPEPINVTSVIDKEDETIMFTFFVPLKLSYQPEGTEVEIEFTDPTMYTAFKIPIRTLIPNGNTDASIYDTKINYAGIINYRFSQ